MISKRFQDSLTELEMIADKPCLCKATDGMWKSCIAQEELYGIYQEVIRALERIKE